MKNERQQQILEVARELFLHHGFQKVTLGDIAKELGVSRPTVYQAFPNKEEIFKAIVEQHNEQSLQRVAEVRNGGGAVGKKLNAAIKIWIVEPYQVLEKSPGAAEILDSCFGFAEENVDRGYARFEAEIEAILEEGKVPAKLPLRDLAHLMTVSLRGFKSQVKSLKELRKLIANLLVLVLPNES